MKYHRFDNTEREMKQNSNAKWISIVVVVAAILGIIVYFVITATATSNDEECEWSAVDCATEFPHVGAYCAIVEGKENIISV